ncbi:MAG: transcriptional repressor [Verrucomicrobiae bacterium]|nr:transcriptional repressor [Verrucomicrobiae bacterium]
MIDPEIKERFDDYIREKGLRRTSQRDVIVEAAFSTEEHFTAEQLWDFARRIDPTTSRATLYRTLSLLVESGLLREIDLGRDQKYYDPNFVDHPHHNHLICVDCGKVIEFEDEHIETLFDCITRRLGFRPTKKSMRIEACCDRLRKDGICENLIEMRLGKKGKATRKAAPVSAR